MFPFPVRNYWVATLEKTALPVFQALAAGELKQRMPVEERPGANRAVCTHLEAMARALDGIAPWLELPGLSGEEESKRAAMAGLVMESLDKATHPKSPDFMNFSDGQALVDAGLLAQGLLRCRNGIWEGLDAATRGIKPPFNNWLLFAAGIEAFLASVGEEWDAMRVDYAIHQHEQWYKGDGIYGDGPFFHWDYYNSYVIQPMLLDVLDAVSKLTDQWSAFREHAIQRAQRYSAVLERLISPDGFFPPLGRSLAYRHGAFHLLGHVALLDLLPPVLRPAQVRCALTAVMNRVMEQEGTFDEEGWLTIGLCGHQPGLGEAYVSTGSLYFCLCGMGPLGLPPEHPFWSGPEEDWTSRKAWSGKDVESDHCLIDYDSHILRVK
jgi:hypothetical protein